MTRSTSFGYLLREMTLIVIFCGLFLFANTWRVLADYQVIRVGVSILTLAVLIWGWLILRKRIPTPAPLIGPVLIFLTCYSLAALTSIDPRRSIDEVWVTAMYCFVFLGVAQLVTLGWPREVFVKALLIAGAILAGVAWWVAVIWYRGWLSAMPGIWVPEIAFRLPLANGLATFLNLLTLAAMARLATTKTWIPRLLLGGWIVSALGLSYLTASRGGWLGLAAGLGCLLLLGLWKTGGWLAVQRGWQWVRQHLLIALIGATLGLILLIGGARLALRQVKNPTKTDVQDARTEFWVPAWRVFTEKPFLGQGPLTFGSAYLRINSVPPYGFFPHAHSIPFNLLAETGVVGTVGFGILAIAAFVSLGRQVRVLKGEDFAVAAGVLAGAVAWAAHSLVDTVSVEPMNSATFAVLLGVALAPIVNELASSKGWQGLRMYAPPALGMILVGTGFFNIWRLTPLHEGVIATVRSDWQAARTDWQSAIQRDPSSVNAHLQLGLAESILAREGDSSARDAAIREFETVVRLDPDWWLYHANLAALYGDKQAFIQALAEMRSAVRLGPGSALLQLDYGLLAEQSGNPDEAKQAYQAALKLRPDWAEAYLWRQTSLRQDVIHAWQTTGNIPPNKSLAELEQQGLVGDRVRDYTPLIAAYLQAGQLDKAAQGIKLATLAYADTGEDRLELNWLEADLAARKGDYKTAIGLGQSALDGYAAQSVFGPGSFGAAPYSVNFYRQESTAVDLVPQLPEVPLTDKWADRWVTLGDWQASSGDVQAAHATYVRLLELVPDNQLAKERLR